jgi:hypothetical protein
MVLQHTTVAIASTKTAEPLQHVQEAVLGKGEVCWLQLHNKSKTIDCYYIIMSKYQAIAKHFVFADFLISIFEPYPQNN